MILTEEKTYTMPVTVIDSQDSSGLCKNDMMLEFTNLELLHAVLTCTMPAGRLTPPFREKRKSELLQKMAMVENALEVKGDQLVKSARTMYLDVSEKGTISHYLGAIFAKIIAGKMFQDDYLVHINQIEQPGLTEIGRYGKKYRYDLIGMQKGSGSYSVWESVGRSENSRNRVFAFDEDGTLKTKPYDESKVEDPSLIIYNAMKQYEDKVILTNGSQTDTIYETFENGGSIEDAVMKMTYEPDEPNWTSRINAVFNESESTYSLSIIRKEGSSPVRVIYSYPCQKGWGHCIHTYLESESDLLPPFTVDPQRIEIPSSIQELADEMWNALNEDNRISLFVQFGDEMTVLNKNNGD